MATEKGEETVSGEETADFLGIMVDKCMQCRFFGTWSPDWFSDRKFVCKNSKVFALFKEKIGDQFSLTLIEHEASASILHKNRGVDIDIALGNICEVKYFEPKLTLKQKIKAIW